MEREREEPDARRDRRNRATLNRRRLLQAAGTLAAGTAVAGCVEEIGPGGGESVGERPAYSRWIGTEHVARATEERDGFLFVRTGFRELRELKESDDAFAGFEGGMGDDDAYQLAVAPLWGTIAFMFVASLGLIAYGDAAVQVMGAMQAGRGANGAETDSGSETPHSLDAGLLAGELVLFEGDFDVGALDEGVETFEATGEYGDFQIYEGSGATGSLVDTSGLSFAVRDDAILFPLPASDLERPQEWSSLDSTAILESHIDVADGDAEEAADADEDFDWTLRAGGGQAFVLGGHGKGETEIYRTDGSTSDGPDLDRIDPLVADARSFALSMSWDVEGAAILADGGFAYPDEAARPEEAAFEDIVDGATTSSVTVDGSRARVEAEWTADGTGTPSS